MSAGAEVLVGPPRIVPHFMLWPSDLVVATTDMKPDYGIRGLRQPIKAGTKGVVEFTLIFRDAVFYRVHWEPTPEQEREGWLYIMGDHSPDDVGYLLEKQ